MIKDHCKSCKSWGENLDRFREADCMRFPPVPFLDANGFIQCRYSRTRDDQIACGEFIDRDADRIYCKSCGEWVDGEKRGTEPKKWPDERHGLKMQQ